MSDEERKRLIDEALHGARVGPATVTAPAPTPSSAPCCSHCMLKLGTPPPSIPMAPANPYSQIGGYGQLGGPQGNPVWYGTANNLLQGVRFSNQLSQSFNNVLMNGSSVTYNP